MYVRIVKPLLDKVLSFLAIVILSPVFLILSIAVKVSSKGPIFFTQKRVGKNKSFFKIVKFRTMYADTPADVPTHLLSNPEARITKVGHFLRHTSLDELPQIFNILMGKMSIVGPRPALWNQDDLVAQRDLYGANDLTPGLTGYAQVHGRDELSIQEKAKADGYYAQHVSFVLDVKILCTTVVQVFHGKHVVDGVQEKRKDENLENVEVSKETEI